VELELIVAIAVNVLFGIGVATLWRRYFGANAAKNPKRRIGYRREMIEIDSANVPQFQPNWRNIR
jgi:hypothetical protein